MVKADNKEYYYHLDSLRGMAALIVVLLHANWTNHFTQNSFIQFGAIFVDFFFVLSGIVICHAYPNIRAGSDFWTFMKRRFARLYPLHFVTLIAVATGFLLIYLLFPGIWAGAAGLPEMQDLPQKFFLNLVFLNAHSLTNDNSFNVPSWSIGAETTCYILYGVISLFYFEKRTIIYVILIVISFLALISFGKGIVGFQYNFGFLRGIYGFFIGCAVYALRFRTQITPPANIFVLIFFSVITVLLLAGREYFPSRFTFFYPVLFGVLIYLLITPDTRVARFLKMRPFLLLGTLSYSIYMLHFLVKWGINLTASLLMPVKGSGALIVMPVWTGDLLLLLYLSLVLGISWVSYNYFEEPMRRYLR
ncbi:MAG: acyltransferase [Alphaproteobacteria bacterium]